MKNLLLIIFFCFCSYFVNAQGGLGLLAGTNYFFGNTATPTIGLMVNHGAAMGEGHLQFAINYHFPISVPGTGTASLIQTGFGQNNEPIPLGYKNKITLLDFDYCGRVYFGNNSFDEGGFYPLIGFSLGYGLSTIIPDTYDRNLYTPDFIVGEQKSIAQLSLSLGYGYDKVFENSTALGVQLFTNLNAKKMNSTNGVYYIPSFLGMRVYYSVRQS